MTTKETKFLPTEQRSIYMQFPELTEIPLESFPKHLFIIPDGNRRDAKEKGESPVQGHARGLDRTLDIFRNLRDIPQIEYVTLWAFSSDNWRRPQEEVDGLMNLLAGGIQMHLGELHAHNAKLVHLGRKDRIPKHLADTLALAEEHTAHNTGQTISLAIDFGGEDQDVRIAQKLARDIKAGFIRDDEIDADYLASLRDGNGLIPPADLLLRSSGEQRTSNPGWLVGAQTELYFIDKNFPQIDTSDVVSALLDFSGRQRRLGK